MSDPAHDPAPLHEQVTELIRHAAQVIGGLVDPQVQHGMIAQALVSLAWSAPVDRADRQAVSDLGRGYGATASTAPARADILVTAQIYATLATARP